MIYIDYDVTIKMKNGQKIEIRDNRRKPFFRKYEFITLNDLEAYKEQLEDTVR